ncbi:MlaC/ttg2D family ABC transporter substrate-binding protein [Pelistega suis]|uniref:MlaC/ttg2D family ABC transporter substrate-binding protein n=1 Tax=Pelistega suis TaxID=1631957 RepID=UPI00211CD511|nr:ABC transporter substrate-binding protein [Pelistega suis]MCQ9329319.1 ABC transporter substrate-binding protein [Pelistega suis]MDY3332076.1 ABC transporter substrate-binding protein [Pelistega sp.]
MTQTIFKTAAKTVFGAAVFLGTAVAVQAAQDPNQFIENLANQTLNAIKANGAARSGNTAEINKIVDQYVMPSTNLEKTTRLATGAPWRQATAEQKQQLVSAFKGTLVRTYSGAFKNVTDKTAINVQPFRGDANANDVVVRSVVTGAGSPVSIDYRLEKAGDSWKVYDFNVENIWLVENYRNQFRGEINKGGIDGLIRSLQK